ncbi:MAG TPA: M14 family metallopeptidase [Chitinophagaceae bacterium]|nr:M14 family metallopeptidase [Chitinophagaceae bacterium]
MRILSLSLFLLSVLWGPLVRAQAVAPEQFLGYRVGDRYTPHHRIVEYFRYVAAQLPAQVKLQEYGKTNEGRPLLLVFISSPENIANLETIRRQNLQLAGGEGTATGTANKSIVWLSYNVHGNETSSSEAAMLALHALTGGDARARAWLQNTVVIIDPCLNPDGRDRYVNWYQTVVGQTPNPHLETREHYEPWPGGRTNHYYFDLNRDWAWQTQVETRQRMPVYLQWLPQIHVDFHEQGINSPYYFAPAAEPLHEVITPFQRSFQQVIGKNHARYFDAQGWLYFTRERFDLLYPSYGDTYPTYTGSIGMTYEQAGGGGGGRAGSSVIVETGDTLTLRDRVTHHFTTSLSTVEVAAAHTEKLLSEFRSFYARARRGTGDYGAFVIKNNPQDAVRIRKLLDLLDRNKIQYGYGRNSSLRGFSYASGREEPFSLGDGDIIIPAGQTQGTLVQVLFEPRTKLSDSATYDITAWSLPYAFGLQAYATRQAIAATGGQSQAAVLPAAPADAYAYAVRWNGMPAVRLAGRLLQQGIKLRFAEEPFEVGGQKFDRGSLVVLKTGNQYFPGLWDTLRQAALRENVALYPVATGMVERGYDFGSSRMRPMKARRVAVLVGEGINSNAAGEVWHFFDQQLHYPVSLINVNDFMRVDFSAYDVLVLPDGSYRFLQDKAQSDKLKGWVSAGGNLVALESAVAALARAEMGIRPKKAEEEGEGKDPYEPLRRYEARERDFIPNSTPGSIFRVELDNSHPLAFGYPDRYYTLKQDEHIYEYFREGGWNVGVLKKGDQVAGFVGTRLARRLQDGLLFGVQESGSGSVTYLADNVLFRSFWENGKLLFANAVFLVGQ